MLPPLICSLIKPVFENLSSDDLMKYLHGGTHNANESFHSIVWLRCPKQTFVGRSRMELAVADDTISFADDTISFKDGQVSRLDNYKQAGLSVGNSQLKYAQTADLVRRSSHMLWDADIAVSLRACIAFLIST